VQPEPELDDALEKLTQRMESSYPNGWRTNEIPRSEITRRFAGIVGFRMRVTRIEAKFKLGQDEPLRDALAVADQLDHDQTPPARALAALIREQNFKRDL
jgi:transcriptional regulator